MARKKMEDLTPEELQDKLAKLKQQEMKLMADYAVRKHPNLQNEIESVTNFAQELEKADAALKMGADVNVQKKKDSLQRQIDRYEQKIASLRETLASSDETVITKQLQEKRNQALVSLARAFKNAKPDFEKAGVVITDLVPAVQPYVDEVEGVEVPDEAEAA